MKLILGIIAAVVLLVTCNSGKQSGASKKLPEVVSNSGWDGSVYQVEHWLKQNLKDPDSFQAIEWSNVAKTESGFVVRCKYRAKNSFGGYVVDNKMFFLDSSGNVKGSTDIQ